jgi:hypothetical protein
MPVSSCIVPASSLGVRASVDFYKRLPEPLKPSDHALLHPYKMTNSLSLDFKSSALLISLVLVPIVILFVAVAVALSCSEYCSFRFTKPAWLERLIRQRRGYRKKRSPSDLEGANNTESSESPLEYTEPVRSREQV